MGYCELDVRADVCARLNYLVTAIKTSVYAYTFEPPAGTPARRGEVHAVDDVVIQNARPFASLLSLERRRISSWSAARPQSRTSTTSAR